MTKALARGQAAPDRSIASAGGAGARGWLLAAVALVAYCALAPTTIVDGDEPEFAALAALGGRAHPSGYPLYVLWLRAWSWLPAASAAHAAALATCVLAAAAVAALYAACRAWGARPGAAGIAVAIVAASPVVLRVHTEAEVFALNGLVAACVLWLAAANGPLRGTWRAVALAAIAGLGLCGHLSCALLAPIGLVGAWRGVREAPRRGVAVALAAGAFVLGLAPLAYLALAPDTPASWGAGGGLSGVIDHVLRRDYGSTSLSPTAGDAKPVANLLALAETLARAWLWLPLLAGLAALAWRCARPASGETAEPRAGWIALAASWLLAGPIVVSRFNLEPVGFYASTVQRFHLLPALLLAVPVAAALDRAIPKGGALAGARGGALALAVFAALVALGRGAIARVHSQVVEANLADTLRALPAGAVLITSSDEAAFGAPYVQDVQGVRPDVAVVAWSMTGRAWYAQRLLARGIPVDEAHETGTVRALLRMGKPVFVEALSASVLARLPSYPFVGYYRVLAPDAPPPTIGEVADANRAAFAAFDLDYPRPGPDDGYATVIHLRYESTWLRIAGQYEAAGDLESARAARELAAQLAPGD